MIVQRDLHQSEKYEPTGSNLCVRSRERPYIYEFIYILMIREYSERDMYQKRKVLFLVMYIHCDKFLYDF